VIVGNNLKAKYTEKSYTEDSRFSSPQWRPTWLVHGYNEHWWCLCLVLLYADLSIHVARMPN
jgi:hypothetical protein